MEIARNLQGRLAMNDGHTIPQVGLGVWRAQDGAETYNAVRWALEAGYRSIDTASYYENEESVGRAIRDSGVSRKEIFVTTKLWNDEQGYDEAQRAFERSQARLGLEYVDLYLEHFPVTGLFKDTWRALERLVEQGAVRSIGVSNFHAHHLEALLAGCSRPPAVNQIERHPYLTQKEMLAYNAAHGILTECWAPLAKARALAEPPIAALAQKYGRTPAQIILRWHLQQGLVIIPKSVTRQRILENAALFDFALEAQELAAIDALHCAGRIGTDPDDMVY